VTGEETRKAEIDYRAARHALNGLADGATLRTKGVNEPTITMTLAAFLKLAAHHSTNLEGQIGEPAPEGQRVTTAAEFAHYWNALTEAERAETVTSIGDAAEMAVNCTLNHGWRP
jgi:hypothetical protein